MLLSPHVNADIWKMTPTPVGFRNSFYRSLMWFWFSPEALATFQLECLSLPQHHPKAFCSWKWVWTQEKMLLAHILCTCAKMHSTEVKAMWVRLFPSTRLRLAEGLSLHKYTAEMFSSPSSTQGVCCLQRSHCLCSSLLPSAGTKFSNAHLKHLHSICQKQWVLLNCQSATSEIQHSTGAPLYQTSDPKPLL